MEKMVYVGFRYSAEDDLKINLWFNKNDLTMSWVMRRAVKDFIIKYVDSEVMPASVKEELNRGCIKT